MIISKDYWKDFYKTHHFDEPSSFAKWVMPLLDGDHNLVDLGCGDGRDIHFFRQNGISCYGVDASHEDVLIIKQDVKTFMRENESPDNVYTRFFWHAIDDETREQILEWTSDALFIEARTTKDKPKDVYGKHDRNLVNVKELQKQLEKHGFKVIKLIEGYGMSRYLDEDPHLVRVIAQKT